MLTSKALTVVPACSSLQKPNIQPLDKMAECNVEIQNFISTGRTGRRNAMPDVLSEKHGQVSTAGIAEVLDSLNFGPSTSGQSCQSSNSSNNNQQKTSGT